MLYINSDNKTEFVDENVIDSEKYKNIYDMSDDINYTGLDLIRIFSEDNTMGIEIQVDGNIEGGILKVLPKTLTFVSRLNNEEDGSIIITNEKGELRKKLSFTRLPKEYKKILREIQTSSLDSVYIRISSKQKKKEIKQPENNESREKLLEYRKKLENIQKTLEQGPNHYGIEDRIVEAINKL